MSVAAPSLAYTIALRHILAEDGDASTTDVTLAISRLVTRTGWSEVAVAHRILLHLRTARIGRPAATVGEIITRLEESWMERRWTR